MRASTPPVCFTVSMTPFCPPPMPPLLPVKHSKRRSPCQLAVLTGCCVGSQSSACCCEFLRKKNESRDGWGRGRLPREPWKWAAWVTRYPDVVGAGKMSKHSPRQAAVWLAFSGCCSRGTYLISAILSHHQAHSSLSPRMPPAPRSSLLRQARPWATGPATNRESHDVKSPPRLLSPTRTTSCSIAQLLLRKQCDTVRRLLFTPETRPNHYRRHRRFTNHSRVLPTLVAFVMAPKNSKTAAAHDDTKAEGSATKEKHSSGSGSHTNGKMRRVASSTGSNLREVTNASAAAEAVPTKQEAQNPGVRRQTPPRHDHEVAC